MPKPLHALDRKTSEATKSFSSSNGKNIDKRTTNRGGMHKFNKDFEKNVISVALVGQRELLLLRLSDKTRKATKPCKTNKIQ